MTRDCWHCHRDTPGDDPACSWCGVWLVALDPSGAPLPLRPLLAPARRWGIPDDILRAEAVDDADPLDLATLVDTVDGVDPGQIDTWLCGPAASDPGNEDVALSALMMTVEHARLRLDPW